MIRWTNNDYSEAFFTCLVSPLTNAKLMALDNVSVPRQRLAVWCLLPYLATLEGGGTWQAHERPVLARANPEEHS